MEGRHCFAHLTIEENLLTGAFTRRDGKAAIARDLELVYSYFTRIKERRSALAGYTSGGEQQMCAVGRALMSRPKMILLDEPSMGLAPQVVEEIFDIVKNLNEKEGVSFLLAEQNTNMALKYARYGYILENGRVVMDGDAKSLSRERGRQGILPRRRRGQAQVVPRRQALQAAQAVAGLTLRCPSYHARLLRLPRNPRSRAARSRDIRQAARTDCAAMRAARLGEQLAGIDPRSVASRAALAKLPILRKSDLPRLQAETPPFGGFNVTPPGKAKRLLMSPGPIFEPEGHGADCAAWRARCSPRASAKARSC